MRMSITRSLKVRPHRERRGACSCRRRLRPVEALGGGGGVTAEAGPLWEVA